MSEDIGSWQLMIPLEEEDGKKLTEQGLEGIIEMIREGYREGDLVTEDIEGAGE